MSRPFLFKKLLKELEIGPSYIFLPLGLSLAAAIFEGFSTGLLIPLLQGLVDSDFSFLESSIVGDFLESLWPEFFQQSSLRIFALLLGLVFVSTFIRLLLAYFSDIAFSWRMHVLAHRLRARVFEKLLTYGKQFFDQNKQGEIHNTVINFSIQIVHKLQTVHSQLKWVLMLFAYATLMVLISWELTLVVLVMLPLYHLSVSKLISGIGVASDDYARADGEMSQKLFGALSSISIVKVFGKQDKELSSFYQASQRTATAGHDIDRRSLLIYPVQELVTLVLALVLVCCIAYMVIESKAANVSGLLVYIYLLKRSASAFAAVGDFRGLLASIQGLLAKVYWLLDENDKFIVEDGSKEFSGLESAIEFSSLSFFYVPEKPVLRDISFRFEKGKMTALVGPSGSGKSTIANLLLRLYECPANSILLDGQCIRDFQIKSLRRQMAHVSQDTQLFNRSLRDNLTYGMDLEVSADRLAEVIRAARLGEVVDSLPKGLDTVVGDRGVQLSGGEKQRVSIARALLREPQILILDEATSALDATTERLVQEAIDELIVGKTVLVIAHRFSTIRNADCIVSIKDGQVQELGGFEELMKRGGSFSNLWRDQAMTLS